MAMWTACATWVTLRGLPPSRHARYWKQLSQIRLYPKAGSSPAGDTQDRRGTLRTAGTVQPGGHTQAGRGPSGLAGTLRPGRGHAGPAGIGDTWIGRRCDQAGPGEAGVLRRLAPPRRRRFRYLRGGGARDVAGDLQDVADRPGVADERHQGWSAEGPRKVGQQLIDRVTLAVAELGYTANLQARRWQPGRAARSESLVHDIADRTSPPSPPGSSRLPYSRHAARMPVQHVRWRVPRA